VSQSRGINRPAAAIRQQSGGARSVARPSPRPNTTARSQPQPTVARTNNPRGRSSPTINRPAGTRQTVNSDVRATLSSNRANNSGLVQTRRVPTIANGNNRTIASNRGDRRVLPQESRVLAVNRTADRGFRAFDGAVRSGRGIDSGVRTARTDARTAEQERRRLEGRPGSVVKNTLEGLAASADLQRSVGGPGLSGSTAGSVIKDPAALGRAVTTNLLGNENVLRSLGVSDPEATAADVKTLSILGALAEEDYMSSTLQSLSSIWEAGSLLYDAYEYSNPPAPRISTPSYLYNPDGSRRNNPDGTPRSVADVPDFPSVNMNPTVNGVLGGDSGSGSYGVDSDSDMKRLEKTMRMFKK
jgi:hypothetical protein